MNAHRAVGMVVVAAALVSVAAYAATLTRDSDPASAVAVQSSFAVTTGTPASDDKIPVDRTAKIRDDSEARHIGVRWAQARRATAQDGVTVYVVPANDGICMVTRNPADEFGLACASLTSALSGDLHIRFVLDDTTFLAGLMPDGVARITVTTETTRSAPVRNNAYVVDSGKADGTLAWTDLNGAQRSIPIPPSPFSIDVPLPPTSLDEPTPPTG